MPDDQTLAETLARRGVSRRTFLKFCATMASLMAMPPAMAAQMAEKLARAKRQSVIWLSFQECTGCTESITRSHSPTLESLIFDAISLDYHHTLQAASGTAAEAAREHAMKDNYGKYLLVVDGSVPTKDGGVYSTIAGVSNVDMLVERPRARQRSSPSVPVRPSAASRPPDPIPRAVAVSDIADKPIINVPGCRRSRW
jgi:hydrogenase small subunit